MKATSHYYSRCNEGRAEWFAIYTKPNAEQIAADSIESLDLEVFFPRCREVRTINGVKYGRVKPLFSCYIFARFNSGTHRHLIKYCRGVNDVVCCGATPIPVEDEVIDSIRDQIDRDGFVVLRSGFSPGDSIAVRSGPLEGLSGIFHKELSGQHRAIIFLNSLYPTRAIVDTSCLVAVTECTA